MPLKHRIILIAFPFVIFFVISEIATRIYTRYTIFYDIEMTRYANEVKIPAGNPKIGHIHRPNAEAHLMGVDVSINSDGLRDKEYPVERNSAYRIAILGDSLTFGWGVEKDQTFDHLLESKLNSRRSTEVINFAAGNYNTEQQVNVFFKKGKKYRPDHVVMFYFINDAEVTPKQSMWEFLSWSRAITFYWSRINALLSRYTQNKSFKAFYSALYEDDHLGWINTQKAFIEIRDYCAEQKIPLQVVMLPELHNVKNYIFKEEYKKVYSFLRSNYIDVLDITPSFSHIENPIELWVALDDAHPNARAHQIIANASLRFIRQKIR